MTGETALVLLILCLVKFVIDRLRGKKVRLFDWLGGEADA